MLRDRDQEQLLERVILLFILALFLLLSPIVNWWAADDNPWYIPYLIWGALILLIYRLQRRLKRHDL